MANKDLSAGDTDMRDKGVSLAEFTRRAFQVEGAASTDTLRGMREDQRLGRARSRGEFCKPK